MPFEASSLGAYLHYVGSKEIRLEPASFLASILRQSHYYYQQVKAQFESFSQDPEDISPLPCRHCQVCSWKDTCDSQWESDDHLSLIANIHRSQIDKLQQAGIKTVTDLAKSEKEAIHFLTK